MPPRYRAALALTLALAAPLPAFATPRSRHVALKRPPLSAPPAAAALYSRRALRRARIILQLELLELRAERLERVRKAIERNIPIQALLESGTQRTRGRLQQRPR